MAVTLKASNTQTAVISTEHSLLSTTDPGVYILVVDLVNMASGDTLELRIKEKVLSGGTIRGLYYQVYSNAQPTDRLIVKSVASPTDLGGDFTLKQTAGTGRNFPWKVLAI